MKKILTLFALLLPMAMVQATVITKSFDLSQFSNYGTATVSGGTITDAAAWAGAQSWEWMEGASSYDQVVLEVANHTEKILFRVQYSDATEVQKELPEGTNSMAIDIEQDIIKGITVLNWSENSDIDITITGLYMRGAIGIKKDVTLWSGTKEFDEFDWEHRLLIDPAKFSDLHVGDILEVHYTTNAESYHQFDIKTNYDNNYPSFAPSQISLGGSNETGLMRFYIAESSDLSNIAAKGGLYLNGKYITFTEVSVIKHEVLWTGTTEAGDWSGYQEINASKLADLKVGNIINVRVSAIGTEGSINLYCGWEDADALAGGVYYFQGGDEAPMVVEFPVTYKMKKQLRGKNLLVRGKNYTMTDVYVKEGTPVTTVAEYLNVTTAEMATLVLPFNVPALPEGVKAYNLTNDGTNEITATEVSSLTADKPVLIIADEGEYEFLSEDGASDDISGKTGTYTNGALVGTYQPIADVPTTSAANYNYILQNGTDGVAFYQVTTTGCSIAPYHAYLSCGYNSQTGGTPAPMRIRFQQDAATAVSQAANSNPAIRKRIIDGQLFIEREGTLYTTQGQIVK